MSEELTAEELADMRRVADAATEGEWDCHALGAEGSDFDIFERDHGRSVASAGVDDAQFIAKFDPPTVRRMLDKLEGLSRDKFDWEDCALVTGLERDGFAGALTAARADLAAKDAEIARLLKFACDYCEGHGEQWYPGEHGQDPRDFGATGSVEQCDECNGSGRAQS